MASLVAGENFSGH